MRTYATLVLGCKVNDYEASYVEQEMNKDYQKVSFKERADIYLIFTCAVTNVAEAKSRKYIHQARRLNPDAYIVAIGCYVQTGKIDEFKDVDLLIGTGEKAKIKSLIDEAYKGSRVKDLKNIEFEEMFLHSYQRKDRAFLKIQDGCNQYCSFCVIPYARGQERSAKHELVIKQAQELVKQTPEIVLTGIHTGRYDDGVMHLSDLLKELVKIEDLKTLRLSSIEVTELPEELIQLLVKEEKLANHLHIPLQSGSDNILEKMIRPYDCDYFYEKVSHIRELIPDINISTDLIVGFPNESEEDFLETLNFIKKVKFGFIHVFPYARKKGTSADKMSGFVKPEIVKERIKKVNEVQKEIRKQCLKEYIGKEVEVFVENEIGEYKNGYCKQYFPVSFKGECSTGSIVNVKIVGSDDDSLKGELCF